MSDADFIIYKYPLAPDSNGFAKVWMPPGATLSSQTQDGEVCVWMVHNLPLGEMTERTFLVAMTGLEFKVDPYTHRMSHVTSYQIGSSVWHIFEILYTQVHDGH